MSSFYEEGTRRLARTVVDRSTASTRLDDINYSYDAVGNITKIVGVEDNTTTDTQCFDYDYLRRMAAAWTATDGCAAAPSAATVGGPRPYWHSYTFDKVGNRLTETQHDPDGDAAQDVTRSYRYPEPGQPQPHTLRSVQQTGPTGARLDEYSYDETGNTTLRKLGGDEQKLEWDAEGHLAKVTKGNQVSEYLYDADGNRLIRRDPDATTLYLGSTELKLARPSNALSATRYITAGAAIAVRTSDGQLNYQLVDHHGTAQETINAATQATTRRKFTPYGQNRGAAPPVWPGEKGFVGGTIDAATGLTHLGAREYDADTGRFVSVDPIMDSSDPQQIHGYAYSNNSPVTFTDPSGLKNCADDCGDGDSYEDSSGKIHIGSNHRSPPAGGQPKNSGPSEHDVKRAKKIQKKKILDVVIEHGGKILMEVLGINDIRDCVMNGDIGACVMAVVGALPWGKILKAKKISQALWKAGKAVLSWMDDMKWAKSVLRRADEAAAASAKQADEAATAAKQGDEAGGAARGGDEAGASCSHHSFTPETEVLMADGTTKAIKDVELGDKVLATDPETGRTVARKVTRLHRNQDNGFTDVTVRDSKGNVFTINTTQHHPFWDDADDEWVDASALVAGDQLRTTGTGNVTVVAARSFVDTQTMHDLSVGEIHTYHVLAADIPVLVHNCGETYDNVALGTQDHGVREFAESNGYTHFVDETREDALASVRDVANNHPEARIHVRLDGFKPKAGSPADLFKAAYDNGGGDNWYTTEREMNILGRAVRMGNRSWDSIQFHLGGEKVSFPRPDYLGG